MKTALWEPTSLVGLRAKHLEPLWRIALMANCPYGELPFNGEANFKIFLKP